MPPGTRARDTPAFAFDTISGWWQTDGRAVYPEADHLLVLADAGGSNGFQIRAWKERLQAGSAIASD
jgi:Rhodopirellula transposase DDE domain